MGYTRVIQYGDITEIYEYEKLHQSNPRRSLSLLEKKRQKERRALNFETATRTAYSTARSIRSFFRLCHHNVGLSSTVTFATITLVEDSITYEEASRYIAHFWERIKKRVGQTQGSLPISYISVPEFGSESGRLHFHLLIFNLPAAEVQRERSTRNFQRQFRRGYIDFLLAYRYTTGIAGYMAKYMAKNFRGAKSASWRGYHCSRNIDKIYSAGSNSLDGYLDLIVGDSYFDETSEYDTVWLGRAIYKRYRIDHGTKK